MTASIYDTRLVQKDIRYRAWLTEVNYILLMNTGAPMHGNSALNFQRMRRWYLAGMDAYTAAVRLNS